METNSENIATTPSGDLDAGAGGDAPYEFSGLDHGNGQDLQGNLDFILDIPLEITIELGRTSMQINDLLKLGQGSVIELSKLAGETAELGLEPPAASCLVDGAGGLDAVLRDEVEPLAGGRVWHARAARDVDLVDGVGSRRDLVESLARRLRCRPERIVLRHVGGSGPLEDVGGLSLVESGLLEAADSLRLVGSERMAAELPLYPAG